MTAVRLSDRQAAALLALPVSGEPVTGDALASAMSANGRETSPAGAHQAANALDYKSLAVKIYTSGQRVTYVITEKGRVVVGELRAQPQ